MTRAGQFRKMPGMNSEIETRLLDLETRNSYLERNIQELSESLYAQQRLIDRLDAQLRSVSERVKELNPAGNDLPVGERPPHY